MSNKQRIAKLESVKHVDHAGDISNMPAHVRTIEDVLRVLDYSLAETMPLENSIQRSRLIVSVCAAFLDALKVKELESRIMAIEAALKNREVTK